MTTSLESSDNDGEGGVSNNSLENASLQSTTNAEPESANAVASEMLTGTDHEVPSSDSEQQQLRDEQISADDMVVRIKFLRQGQLMLHCQPNISIAALKQLVLEARAMQIRDAPNEQTALEETATAPLRLIYKGKVLKDDQTLSSYDFSSGDTLHAVHGRPGNCATSENANVNRQTESSGEAVQPTAGQETASAASSANAGTDPAVAFQHLGNGVMVGQINIETNGNATAPELNALLNTVVSAIQNPDGNARHEPAQANFRFGGNGEEMLNTIITSMFNSDGRSVSGNVASFGGGNEQLGATQNANTAGVIGIHVQARVEPSSEDNNANRNGTEQHAPNNSDSASTVPHPANLIEHAARIRQSLPPMELAPLTRPPDLPIDMYNLGIAIREASDTFLSIHRQLQFLATRFLHANHLTELERNRLGYRIHSLIPSLREVRSLIASLTTALENAPQSIQPSGPPPNFAGQAQTLHIRSNTAAGDVTPMSLMSGFFSGIIGSVHSQAAQNSSEASSDPTPNTSNSVSSPQQSTNNAREERSDATETEHPIIGLRKLIKRVILANPTHSTIETGDQTAGTEFLQNINCILARELRMLNAPDQTRNLEESARDLRAALESSQHRSLLVDGITLELLQTTLRHILQLYGQDASDADTIYRFRHACQHFCGALYWHVLNSETISSPSDAITITAALISDSVYHLAYYPEQSPSEEEIAIRAFTTTLRERVQQYLHAQLR